MGRAGKGEGMGRKARGGKGRGGREGEGWEGEEREAREGGEGRQQRQSSSLPKRQLNDGAAFRNGNVPVHFTSCTVLGRDWCTRMADAEAVGQWA